MRGTHTLGNRPGIFVKVDLGQLTQRPNVVFPIPLISRLHSIASEHTGASRALPLSRNVIKFRVGRDENHRTAKRQTQGLGLLAKCAKPRATIRIWVTINVKVISVVVEAIVRSSETPETLRKTSVNHASTRSLKDVKVSALNHGIALRHTGTTGFVQDFKLPARSDDLTGAVRINARDLIDPPEIAKSAGGIPKVLRLHGTELSQGGMQVLQDKSVSCPGQRLHGRGDNVITGDELHKRRRVTTRFECTFKLLVIPHLTSLAGITVRIRRLVIQHVLKSQRVLLPIPPFPVLRNVLPVRDGWRRGFAIRSPWGNNDSLRITPHDESPWGNDDGGGQSRPRSARRERSTVIRNL
jgi:hypothetical protein